MISEPQANHIHRYVRMDREAEPASSSSVLNAVYQICIVCLLETFKLITTVTSSEKPERRPDPPRRRSKSAHLKREQKSLESALSSKLQVKSLKVDPALLQQRRSSVPLDRNNNTNSKCIACSGLKRSKSLTYSSTKPSRLTKVQCLRCKSRSAARAVDNLPKSFETFLFFANKTVLGQRKRPSISHCRRMRSLEVVSEEDEL